MLVPARFGSKKDWVEVRMRMRMSDAISKKGGGFQNRDAKHSYMFKSRKPGVSVVPIRSARTAMIQRGTHDR